MNKNWFKGLLIFLMALFETPTLADVESIPCAGISIICYGTQNTWIRCAGKTYEIPHPTVTLLRTKKEFDQASGDKMDRGAELKDIFRHVDSIFRNRSYDCIMAFPASFSYQERLQTVQLLGAHVDKVRISTISEIAALGYNHYHLPLSEKKKEEYSTKLFVVLDGQYVSATLAELGYLGVVEVHGSVGVRIASLPTEKKAYLNAINKVMEILSRLPDMREHRYDEMVLSGSDDLAEIVEGLKAEASIRPRVSVCSKLVLKGLLTQSAMLHGSKETEDDLLLVATPQSSLGLILPVAVDMQRLTRLGYFKNDVTEFRDPIVTVPEDTFLDVVQPFTTIPTEKIIVIHLSETPLYFVVAEQSGDKFLTIQRMPWSKDLKLSKYGNRLEISFDINANMMTEVKIKDVKSGGLYKHRVAFSVE